jgi:hypothetical protein
MEILRFLGDAAAYALDPAALATGIFLGYLFHADWVKLAWALLLFVVPGVGSMWKVDGPHGSLYYAAAEFFAICTIVTLSYRFFEFLRTRRRRT